MSSPSMPSPTDFTGSIPEYYERHLVPVIFTPYADDLIARVPAHDGVAVLEVACGTGVVTRRLPERLPDSARIVATDLHEDMLAIAKQRMPAGARVEFRAADGAALPFGDGEFDAVLCQFGVMFFPDKLAGMKEASRVLKPGGRLLFNVMDAQERNPFGRIAHQTIASFFENDAPTFYLKPFSWADTAVIGSTLRDAGFREVSIEKVPKELRGESVRDFATGLVRGNPVIEASAERRLDPERIIDRVADGLREVYGDRPFRGPIQAIVVTAIA